MEGKRRQEQNKAQSPVFQALSPSLSLLRCVFRQIQVSEECVEAASRAGLRH